jgi:hypothetical protein
MKLEVDYIHDRMNHLSEVSITVQVFAENLSDDAWPVMPDQKFVGHWLNDMILIWREASKTSLRWMKLPTFEFVAGSNSAAAHHQQRRT